MRWTGTNRSEALDCSARDIGLDGLPNDLTKLLYLASLRDCNSGRYLHPELSRSVGIEEANRQLFYFHNRVFHRLLTTRSSEYAFQLEEYIRYTRIERQAFLHAWRVLGAYRATVPMLSPRIYVELFCLNIELAMALLKDPNQSLSS